MKQHQSLAIKSLVAAVLAIVSAGAIAAGGVTSSGAGVEQVYGRATGMPSVMKGSAVHVTSQGAVSDVVGRGSRIPAAGPARVQAIDAGVEQFGRGSTIAMSKPKVQGDTLAQTR